MDRIFEPGPLLAAALIGGVVLWALFTGMDRSQRSNWRTFATGAVVGLAVQLGVRGLGVS